MLFGSAHILYGMYDVKETSVFVPPMSSVKLVEADPNRVTLLISVLAGSSGLISTKNINAINSGLAMSAGNPSVFLNIHDHPGLVQSAWFAESGASSYTISAITSSEHPTDAIHYD